MFNFPVWSNKTQIYFSVLSRFRIIQMELGLILLPYQFWLNVCEKTDNPIKIDTVNLFHGQANNLAANSDAQARSNADLRFLVFR